MAFQDFDLIQERRRNERKQKIKKRIIIGVVSSIVLLCVAGAAVGVVVYQNQKEDKPSSHSAAAAAATTASPAKKATPAPPQPPKQPVIQADKVVKTICGATDYQPICESKLLEALKANASASQPNDLLKASMAAAAEEVDKVIASASSIKIDDPMKKAAFNDCMVLLNDAKEELNSSISSIDGKNVGKLSSTSPELNNWLSAVMSYQQTCVDGIPEGEEKDTVETALKNVRELTSNSLAMVSQISTALLGANIKRRLLAKESSMPSFNNDGLPTWMDQEHHRILKADAPAQPPNVTVAKDSSGNFTTISAALAAMPENYEGRYIIYVKGGIYEENLVVTKTMVNVTIYGEGSQKTVVTGSKNFVDGTPTFQTATFAALGDGFMAQSIGFRNTAGPEKHQAVALRVQADRAIFLNCRMEGYQDTLYAQTHRQYYRGCYITGTVDFIFGDAAAIFQNCMIYVRRPMDNQQNIITAQGRIDKHETTGIVLQNCRILADDKLEVDKATIQSYLGRPWKEYSRTIVMETEIGDLINPEGWFPWNQSDFALSTLYYAEFNNKGPGAQVTARVKWPGYQLITRADAIKFTVGPFLQGESWIKAANVPFRLGLFN